MKKFNIADWYDLKGQVAIVTGGATGLGLAITRCLISAGAVVCVAARSEPEKVAEALEEFGYIITGSILRTRRRRRSWWTESPRNTEPWIFW